MGETEPPSNQFFNPLEAVGTDGAQKCRGSGAPNPNQPLCHAMCAAAIFFEVVAKVWTVATNFLKLCKGSADGLASVLPVLSGVNCVAYISRICNGSG